MGQAKAGKRTPRAQHRPPAPARGKQRKRAPDETRRESDDIERAVYDGMQDLRVERDKNR